MAKYRFTERKTLDKLQNGDTLIYFEEVAGEETNTTTGENGEGTSETYPVYDYSAVRVSGDLSKGAIVNAIIRTKYSQADVEAILRHKIAGEDDGEFDAFNAFAEETKARAVEILENE